MTDPVSAAILAGLAVAWWAFKAFLDRPEQESVDPDPSLERDVVGEVAPLPEGLALSVSDCRGPDGRWARIGVSGVCPEISIRAAAPGGVELGDPELAGRFAFRGPPGLLSAMMDADARAALMTLLHTRGIRANSVVLSGGTLQVDTWRERVPLEMDVIVGVAVRAVALARRLQTPADVPARLSGNALSDPLPGVRLENLRALTREHAGLPLTRRTLREAARHADLELRLMAAVALGEEGRPVLEALARDTTVEDEVSAGAMAALDALPLAEVEAVLATSLGREHAGFPAARPFTARACADLLAQAGAAAVPLLADVVQSGSVPVALAGIRALHQIGTVEVAIPLRRAMAVGEMSVRWAARRALDDIQFGLAATPGAVSLAGGEAGQVSVVEDPGGRVSLPARERKA